MAGAASAGMAAPAPHPPRVEYLATLTRHSGVVNCVRFSPSGDTLASAGDGQYRFIRLSMLGHCNLQLLIVSSPLSPTFSTDGTVMLWHLTDRPTAAFGEDQDVDSTFEKEHWKMSKIIRVSTQEIYDLSWSPNGDFLIVGGTDFVARVVNPHDGVTVREYSDHTHYVQGVAWDPLNEYLATQSSDRSVHVHALHHSNSQGSNSSSKSSSSGPNGYVPPVTRNSRMDVHRRNQSGTYRDGLRKPTPIRRGSSHASVAESDTDDDGSKRKDGFAAVRGRTARSHTPMEPPTSAGAYMRPATPTSSVPQSPAFSSTSAHPMNPPQHTPSRRSSFSGSQAETAASPPTSIASFAAPGSASAASIYKAAVGISTTPVIAASGSHSTLESAHAHGRRSASGARSLRSPSPAPLPAIRPPPSPRQRIQAAQLASASTGGNGLTGGPRLQAGMRLYGDESFSGFFRRLSFSPDGALLVTPSGIFDAPSPSSPNVPSPSKSPSGPQAPAGPKSTVYLYGRASLNKSNVPLAHLPGHKTATLVVRFSPVLYELRKTNLSAFFKSEDGGGIAPHPNIPLEAGKQKVVNLNSDRPDEAMEGHGGGEASPASPLPPPPVSMIALPYRMVFAVATHDVVWIYDTQQGGPLCCFSNMHYASFTDLTWSADGQTLIMSSSDGYCSVAVFGYEELGRAYNYQKQPGLNVHTHGHASGSTPATTSSAAVQSLGVSGSSSHTANTPTVTKLATRKKPAPQPAPVAPGSTAMTPTSSVSSIGDAMPAGILRSPSRISTELSVKTEPTSATLPIAPTRLGSGNESSASSASSAHLPLPFGSGSAASIVRPSEGAGLKVEDGKEASTSVKEEATEGNGGAEAEDGPSKKKRRIQLTTTAAGTSDPFVKEN